MSYHVAKQNGATYISDKDGKVKNKIKFKEGDILEDFTKKELEHCPQLEYNSGNPPKEGEEPEEESSEE